MVSLVVVLFKRLLSSEDVTVSYPCPVQFEKKCHLSSLRSFPAGLIWKHFHLNRRVFQLLLKTEKLKKNCRGEEYEYKRTQRISLYSVFVINSGY